MVLALKGKVAAITGGSDGIGKATALRLAQEGAMVAICGRGADVLQQAADDIKAAGGRVLAVVADVTNPADCQRFIAETVNRFGRLDILVNNASPSSANHFETVDDEVWQADLELKLFGAIRCSRAAILHMKQQGAGASSTSRWWVANSLAPGRRLPPSAALRARPLPRHSHVIWPSSIYWSTQSASA